MEFYPNTVCLFALAATTEYHILSGLSKRNLLSHSSGGHGLVHLRAVREGSVSGPSPRLADNSLPSVPPCHCPSTHVYVQTSPFYKNTSHAGSGPSNDRLT